MTRPIFLILIASILSACQDPRACGDDAGKIITCAIFGTAYSDYADEEDKDEETGKSTGYSGALRGSRDDDGDGISTFSEMVGGYNPNDFDTDDDGLSDGEEDINGNGRLDPGETDPNDPDSDNDGICDATRTDNDNDGIDPGDGCTGSEPVFVNANNVSGVETGTSWGTGYTSMQEAVSRGEKGGAQVWVAEGNYFPANDIALVEINQGLELYGGFKPGDTSLAGRTGSPFNTVLQGQRETRHIVDIADGVDSVIIDGFSFRGEGNSVADLTTKHDGHDEHAVRSAVDSQAGSLDISNSIFMNMDNYREGAAINATGVLAVDNVAFVETYSHRSGGAIYHASGALEVSNSLFFKTTGVYGVNGPAAGAIQSVSTTYNHLSIENSSFLYVSGRGAASVHANRGAAIRNSVFYGNLCSDCYSELSLQLYSSNSTAVTEITNSLIHTTNERLFDYHMNDGTWNIYNSVIYTGPGGISVDFNFESDEGDPVIDIAYTCTNADVDSYFGAGWMPTYGAPGNLPPLADANIIKPYDGYHYLLDTTVSNDCLDLANSDLGGYPDNSLVSATSGLLSEEELDGVGSVMLDAGKHYFVGNGGNALIKTLAINASTVSWETENAVDCAVSSGGKFNLLSIENNSLVSGNRVHDMNSGEDVYLICMGASGEPALAETSIP